MDKKKTAGIIAAIAAVIAIIIVVLELTGTLKFGKEKAGNENTSSNIVSQTGGDNDQDKNNDSSEKSDVTSDSEDGSAQKTGNTSDSAEVTPEKKDTSSDSAQGQSKTDKDSDKNNSKVDNDKGNAKDTSSKSESKPVKKEDVKASKSDSEIIVPVYIEKNPGIVAAKPVLKFDNKVFSYADCKDADIFSGWQGNASNGKIVLLGSANDVTKDNTNSGVLVNVILTPKKGIKAGTYKITVENESEYANAKEKLVKPAVSVADIVIK